MRGTFNMMIRYRTIMFMTLDEVFSAYEHALTVKNIGYRIVGHNGKWLIEKEEI